MNHQSNAALAIAALVLAAFILVALPPRRPVTAPTESFEAPVPMQESTPTADAGALRQVVLGRLPPPGPNQLRAGQCDPDQAQVEINGGCWLETKKPPPCPRGKLWEHEGRCWIPVAQAKPVPQSGEARPRGVAEP